MKILIGVGSLTAIVLVKQLPYLRFSVTSHIRKRGVGFKATQSSLGVSEDSKDIKDPKCSGKSQVKVYLELNL